MANFDPVAPLAQALLTCLCEQAALGPNPPQNCCFRVGNEVAHDADQFTDLCCEGLAYVRLGDVFPSTDNFPDLDVNRQAQENCGIASWGVELTAGLLRCVPMPEDGTMPSCTDWNAAATQNFADSATLRATACCFVASVRANPLLLGMSAIIGRQSQSSSLGGCIERSIGLTVQIPNCDC